MDKNMGNYEPTVLEEKWYSHWESKGYFRSIPDDRPSFSILIPPPNVTGVLHMGHMLNNTIQDVLIRRARLKGMNACWVPGTDHASIATEAKVVKLLREKGIKKSDLTRDEFLKHAWSWKEEYGGKILKQLRKLGASADWERTAFTMDEVRSDAVIKAFVDLYNKDYLYRKKRMVNWDPQAKTVLSNEEVIHENENANLYYVRYQIEGSDEKIIIATTRPETIMGDTAVAVNPDDPRYTHLKGKRVIVPMVNRSIPIIFDDYVEIEFGTGALKVTPAHDVNDYEIGERHNLEVIDVLNQDGTISEEGEIFVGLDRFEARIEVIKRLKADDQVEKIEQLSHNVGRSERTNSIVEPRLSLQWYVDMKQLAPKALDAVMTDEVDFYPKKQKNTYSHWMTNIRDWCISRQLWWGHRIPAWYIDDLTIVARTEEDALRQAKEKLGRDVQLSELRQDEDVLDTWFSSWLWPISVFDGFNDRTELDYYYPTSVLVTGWDIIFLWVARMVIAGYEWEGKRPFDKVYFTGMVRDQQRRKMSKSLGNSPDALELIAKFGADGVRFGMLSCSPAGGDLLFDDKLCAQGSKFSNKLWNALKLINGWSGSDEQDTRPEEIFAIQKLNAKLNDLIVTLEDNDEQFRLSESLIQLYSFIWTDFCSWYLELMKPENGVLSTSSYQETRLLFKRICIILHPYMPFITEEIYQHVKAEGEPDCIVAQYPVADNVDDVELNCYASFKEMVTAVRDIRGKHGVGREERPAAFVSQTEVSQGWLDTVGFTAGLQKLANIEDLSAASGDMEGIPFIVGAEKLSLGIEQEINVEEEIARIEEELKYAKGFLSSVQKKMSNSRFVDNAPPAVVEKEMQKMKDGEERVKILEENLKSLRG